MTFETADSSGSLAAVRADVKVVSSVGRADGLIEHNAQKLDQLWTHDAVHWLTAIGVMILIGIVWIGIARLRLATIGPRRRK